MRGCPYGASCLSGSGDSGKLAPLSSVMCGGLLSRNAARPKSGGTRSGVRSRVSLASRAIGSGRRFYSYSSRPESALRGAREPADPVLAGLRVSVQPAGFGHAAGDTGDSGQKASGRGDSYLTWMVFASLIVVGISTLLQVRRLGPVGARAVLPMFTAAFSIPFCITAVVDGGPATLATLVLVTGVIQWSFPGGCSF